MNEIGQRTLQGDIEPGDAERALSTLLSIRPIAGSLYLYPSSLQVNSRGGDVSEALKLGALLKVLYMDVFVAANGTGLCASSCFFVYLAGIERHASGINRLTTNGVTGNFGPLGVHRPYFKAPEGGPASTKRQEEVMKATATYLQAERVPQLLIDKMMSYASNDIYWLNAEEIRSIGRFQAGVEEELIAKCGYSAKREDQMTARESIRDIQSGTRACMSKHVDATYGPSKQEAIARMRKGWRPW